MKAASPLTMAGVGFAQGEGVEMLGEGLGYFRSGAIAFSEIKAGQAGCATYALTFNGVPTTATLTPTSAPAYGAQSAAYTATVNVHGVSTSEGIVVARKGNYVVYMALQDAGAANFTALDGYLAVALGKLPV